MPLYDKVCTVSKNVDVLRYSCAADWSRIWVCELRVVITNDLTVSRAADPPMATIYESVYTSKRPSAYHKPTWRDHYDPGCCSTKRRATTLWKATMLDETP